MTTTIRSPSQFNLPALVFSDVKDGAHARYTVPKYTQDGTTTSIQLQTPELRAPFGISNFEGKESLQLELTSQDPDKNQQLLPFYKLLESIDRATIDWLHQNQWKAWPQLKTQGKTWSRETVESMYHGLVKLPQDARWAPTIRVKLQDRFGIPPQFFDSAKEPMTSGDLEAGSGCVCLIELGPIWIMSGAVYPSLRLCQAWERTTPVTPEVPTTNFDFDVDYADQFA